MLIRRAERFTYSDVTPYAAYLDRRTFMRLGMRLGIGGASSRARPPWP
mgnify:CR=1 FL=1